MLKAMKAKWDPSHSSQIFQAEMSEIEEVDELDTTGSSHINAHSIALSNFNRLKLAYRFLTPILDHIISSATNFTHKQFKEMLHQRKPICSITRDQYHKACRASEILHRVVLDLKTHSICHENWGSLVIPNLATHLSASQNDVGRKIFIDRPFMKKFVDVHDLVVDIMDQMDIYLNQPPQTNVFIYAQTSTQIVRGQGHLMKQDKSVEVRNVSHDTTQVSLQEDDEPEPTELIEHTSDTLKLSSKRRRKKKKTEMKEYKPEDDIVRHMSSLQPRVATKIQCDKPPTSNPRCPNVPCGTKFDVTDMKTADLENLIRGRVTDEEKPKAVAESSESEPEEVPAKATTTCTENCSQTNRVPCSTAIDAFRALFDRFAEKLDLMIEDGIISPENVTHDPKAHPAIPDEFYIGEMIMYCLQKLHTPVEGKPLGEETTYWEANVDRSLPWGSCCNREYMHLHVRLKNALGTVNLTKSFMEMALNNYFPRSRKTETETGKMCGCKQPTLGSVLKTKCALGNLLGISAKDPKNYKVPKSSLPKQKGKSVFMMSQSAHSSNLYDALPMSSYESTIASFSQLDSEIEDSDGGSESSNIALPYIPDISSLPRIQTNKMRKKKILLNRVKEIIHPKPSVQKYLKDLGVKNLIEASIPAKCCPMRVINDISERDDEPLRASLNSLPLTGSDLLQINDIVNEHNSDICKYPLRPLPHLSASQRFNFELYTNFQENFVNNYDYFIPRLYQIFYFEVFKRDTNTTNVTRNSSSTTSSHLVHYPTPHKRYQHHHHHHYKRTEEPHKQRPTRTQEQHRPRGLFGEFFRKWIFNTEHSDAGIQREMQCNSRSESANQNKRSKVNYDRNRKYVKSKRLQVNYQDFDAMEEEQNSAEFERTEKYDYVDKDSVFGCVPSSIKNYTVSRIHIQTAKVKGKMATRHDHIGHHRDKSPRSPLKSRDKVKQDMRTGPSTSHFSKASESMKETSYNDILNAQHVMATLSATYDLDECGTIKLKGGHSKDKSATLETSKNLGTIYETDEKAQPPLRNAHSNSCKSFYEFLRSAELSSSFQKYLPSADIIDHFEKNQVPPEEFWNTYFKMRREALQKPSKVQSATSSDGNAAESPPVKKIFTAKCKSKLPKPIKKYRSKIPKRIKANAFHSETSSDMTSFSFKDDWKSNLSPKCTSPTSTPTTSRILTSSNRSPVFKTSDAAKNRNVKERENKKTKICFTDILDEVNNNQKGIVSMESLQLIASKNGPGYITVLHPICGCPEVSIFIPCYCHDEGNADSIPLSPRQIEKLTSNGDGRHIVLPSTCRIPQVNNSNNVKFQSAASPTDSATN